MFSFLCGVACSLLLLVSFDWVRSHLRAKQNVLNTVVALTQGAVFGWMSLSVLILLYREFITAPVHEKRRGLKPSLRKRPLSHVAANKTVKRPSPLDLLRSLVHHPDGKVDRSQCVESMQALFSEVSKMIKPK